MTFFNFQNHKQKINLIITFHKLNLLIYVINWQFLNITVWLYIYTFFPSNFSKNLSTINLQFSVSRNSVIRSIILDNAFK